MVLKKRTHIKKKSTSYLLVGFLMILITFLLYFFFYSSHRLPSDILQPTQIKENHKTGQLAGSSNQIVSNSDALSLKNLDQIQNKDCVEYKNKYQNEIKVKSQDQTSIRYQNIHKSIDGQVYRLRFFYKDGAEGERPQYLVYKENDQDEDILIETSPYKKGKLYLKVERSLGEIIYFEEALAIGKEESPYLVFINGQLTLYQENEIDCRF